MGAARCRADCGHAGGGGTPHTHPRRRHRAVAFTHPRRRASCRVAAAVRRRGGGHAPAQRMASSIPRWHRSSPVGLRGAPTEPPAAKSGGLEPGWAAGSASKAVGTHEVDTADLGPLAVAESYAIAIALPTGSPWRVATRAAGLGVSAPNRRAAEHQWPPWPSTKEPSRSLHYHQTWRVGERGVSLVIDPRTGHPTSLALVTVAAATVTDVDGEHRGASRAQARGGNTIRGARAAVFVSSWRWQDHAVDRMVDLLAIAGFSPCLLP